jgi:hypothetical protein
LEQREAARELFRLCPDTAALLRAVIQVYEEEAGDDEVARTLLLAASQVDAIEASEK